MAARFAGKFQYDRQEDFDKFLTKLGLPDENIVAILNDPKKPIVEMQVNGDQITIKRSGGDKDNEVTFTLGEEYDDELIGSTGKAITTEDGDKMKTIVIGSKGKTQIITEYDGFELTYIITDMSTNATCKHIFKRI